MIFIFTLLYIYNLQHSCIELFTETTSEMIYKNYGTASYVKMSDLIELVENANMKYRMYNEK